MGQCTKVAKHDEAFYSSIRRKVHDFFRRSEYPTLNKLTKAITEDKDFPNFPRSTMYNLLCDMNYFTFEKQKRNSVILDRSDIAECRRNYLRKIRAFRAEGREIIFLDELWVNAEPHQVIGDDVADEVDPKTPGSKGGRLILLHAGRDAGFVRNCLCLHVFDSRKASNQSDGGVDGQFFEGWFTDSLLANINPRSVIVLDNAAAHCVRNDALPTMSWTKERIREWLTGRSLEWEEDMIKKELIDVAESARSECDGYRIDAIATSAGHEILRLPPYHCELNPFTRVWDLVRDEVAAAGGATVKVEKMTSLARNAVGKVTPDAWKEYVCQVNQAEEDMWNLDRLMDDLMDKWTGELSESSSSSDEDDDSDADVKCEPSSDNEYDDIMAGQVLETAMTVDPNYLVTTS